MLGGLCLFLFGMDVMGTGLERRAGSSLQALLGRLTTGKIAGLLTGLGVTAVIQSSSATTVMVVGFVNSGLMTLTQAINVIMGANIGTTVTAWILSLGGIESSNIFVQLLKPTSFTPILAVIGVVYYTFLKDAKKKDTGMILLGFATLMFGMDTMSDAVSGLAKVEAFRNMFLLFENPVLGLLAGAVLTAIIQSSSASVGILQALAVTGQVSFGAAVPIIMGQNIGTCITALLSSFGTNKNAKRAAMVHLFFNIIGSLIWLTVFSIVKYTLSPALFSQAATLAGIALAHSIFNLANTLVLLPASSLLEKLAYILVPENSNATDKIVELDDRLLATPSLALDRCNALTCEMAQYSVRALQDGLRCITHYSGDMAKSVQDLEDKTDHFEDIIGTYLVKLSAQQLGAAESAEATKLLKVIADFERIADHGAAVMKSAMEMQEKKMIFSDVAYMELSAMNRAIDEILSLTYHAFSGTDLDSANRVEPLEQIIVTMKETMRTRHILRLQQGECTINAGFVWTDLLSNLERAAAHCSNVAGCVVDIQQNNMNLHESLRSARTESPLFRQQYEAYSSKYLTNF